ncbi:ASCH domain-containing protein [Pirellulaceae bacterium SH501]
MRALSIRQPWAEQIMRGEKVTEYRSMPTNIHGTIYVYASLGRYPKYSQAEIVEEVGFGIEDLPRGLIVGTVDIAGCEDLGEGRFGWILKNPRRLKKLLKPTQQPNPAWFYPFVSPGKS